MALLRRLKIKRIDLVDKGASYDPTTGEGAHVVLFKRDEGVEKRIVERNGEYCVVSEDGSKTLGCHPTRAEALNQLRAVEANKREGCRMEMDEKVEDVEKAGRELSQKNKGKIRAAIDALKSLLGGEEEEPKMPEKEKAKKSEEEKIEAPVETPTEPKADDVLKAAPPEIKALIAALEKRVDSAEKRAEDAVKDAKAVKDAATEREYIQKAGEFTSLPIEAAKFGPILKRASESMSAEDYAEVERVLKAADEAMRVAGLYQEKGQGGSDEGTAAERLDKRAKSLVADGKAVNYIDAINKIQKEDPELARQSLQ